MKTQGEQRTKIKVIAAMGPKRELGYKNDLPQWRLSADQKRMKELTLGKVVVMGKNTYYSLPEKFRPLPNRQNVILTSDINLQIPGVQIFHTIAEMLEYFTGARKPSPLEETEIWIFGGASIYRQFVPMADELHITYVKGNFQADVFFPEFENLGFKKTSETPVPKDDKNTHDTVYTIFTK